LRPEALGRLPHKIGILARRRIDGHFVTTRLEQSPYVIQSSYASTDRQRHKNLFGGPPDDIQHNSAILMTGCDIQKNQLVRPLSFITLRDLYGITGIPQIQKISSFNHSPLMDIKTRYYPFRKHTVGYPLTDALSDF
jgi:hypothetical protein